MGLTSNDKKPEGITLKDAYVKIRDWSLTNVGIVAAKTDDYSKSSEQLIRHLPEVNNITELEIRAVLGEVIYGHLEWAYHKDDGQYKMAVYARAALETCGFSWLLNDVEKNTLKTSQLWEHLSINRP